MNITKYKLPHPILSMLALCFTGFLLSFASTDDGWVSKFLSINKDGSITYVPDEKGNTIPDFSHVGYYHGYKEIPKVKVVKTLNNIDDDATSMIQKAIDEVSVLKPDKHGFRGAILLKKGKYAIGTSLSIKTDGIVLRGEGDATRLIASGKGQRSLIEVKGNGRPTEITGTRVEITDNYVPVGAKSFTVSSAKDFKPGDAIILYRPGTSAWIHDLQMDQITANEQTRQWKPEEYHLRYERKITGIQGNKVFIDNPVVMPMENKYGGGAIYQYRYTGRIREVGIEDMRFESEYASATDEDHGWIAIGFNHIENGWVRNVSAYHFGYACVSLAQGAKNITVTDAKCFDAKSQITGSRRYSFNNDGQQNLFMNLETTEGRHDYVTGAQVCGPNVFYNCKSSNTHADIGPHHRWSTGTLYDNITTDGEINVQDRGNWGTGHGWAGVTQVLWNCKAKGAAVHNPWTSGKNYVIGLQGQQLQGRLKGRTNGEWEGQNKAGLQPGSLFLAQRIAAKMK
ncbi:MAG: hypothetical protein EOO88_16815 [Pedobacter sp.]|nr:MAG: hypothetical protein EOO88_16815 [Pedobacter sp.]